MPANLTPDYLAAEKDFKRAKTPGERLEALRRMLSTIPKHKGTDKLQADIKRRISKINEEIQKSAKKKGFAITVPKDGAGQVVLVGPPNVGKSSLVAALTHATPEVAEYPFTTRAPFPAMMPYEDIQVQLVDLPPVCTQHTEAWIPGIVRTSDVVLLIVDLNADDPLEQIESTRVLLEQSKLRLVRYEPEFDPWASIAEKKCLLIGNKLDVEGAAENYAVLEELYAAEYPIYAVSTTRGDGLEELRRSLFGMLNVIRVYSKPPGKDAEMERPFTLKNGSTLLEFANEVHHDFGEKLRFARVWGHTKFDGQRATKEYVLQDKDIIELHL